MSIPVLTNLLLQWATFLAAIALLLGVVNLFSVHLNRLFIGRNLYSGVLVISLLAIVGLAVTDTVLDMTDDGVGMMFRWVQAPLEAALASLLAFFLLFAGFQMMRRQRTIWSALFLVTAVVVLLASALSTNVFIPASIQSFIVQIQHIINNIFVTAGMRGILIGIALGTITLGLRLLAGIERPYNK